MSEFAAAAVLIAFQHVWQGCLVLGALALAEKLPGRLNADTDYKIYVAALYALAAAPLFIFLPGGVDADFDSLIAARLAPYGEHAAHMIWPAFLAAGAWAGGFVIALYTLGKSLHRGARLRRSASRVSLSCVAADLDGRQISAGISPEISSPMVVGVLQPVLLLPVDFLCKSSDMELRAILEHERGHIQRRDMIFAFAEELIKAFYWWSPFARVVLRRIRITREAACDARAINDKCDVYSYARLLINSARNRRAAPALAADPIAMYAYGDLSHRVERLLTARRPQSKRLKTARYAVTSMAVIACAVFFFAATPRVDGNAAQIFGPDHSEHANQAEPYELN